MTFVYRSNGAFLRACEKFIAFRFDHALRLVCRFSFLISPHFVLLIIDGIRNDPSLPFFRGGEGRRYRGGGQVGNSNKRQERRTKTTGRDNGRRAGRRRADGRQRQRAAGNRNGGQRQRAAGKDGEQRQRAAGRRRTTGGGQARRQADGGQTAGRGNGRRQQERRENGRQRRQGGRKSDFGKPGFFRIFTE